MTKAVSYIDDHGSVYWVVTTEGEEMTESQEHLDRLRTPGLIREPLDCTPLAEIGEIPIPILHVDCDVVDLLDHFDGDEARVFNFLGKLKDVLTVGV